MSWQTDTDGWAMVELGGAWVRIDRIEAIEHSPATGKSRVILAGGGRVYVDRTPAEIVDRITQVTR